MKLTKKARNELVRVLRNLERAHAYIHSPTKAVCRVESVPTTTLHFSRAMDNRVLYEVEKTYGSDLCALETGMHALRSFLETH